MLNMNRATLVGHAGRDPEIRDLKNGGKAATFSLATTEKWTDREGRPSEATEWHRVVVYGPAVEAVGKMLRKGNAVLVEGRIATRGFTDKEGNERAVTDIVVSGRQGMVNILSTRRAPEEAPDAGGSGGPAPHSGSGEPVPPARGPGQDLSEPGGQAPESVSGEEAVE